MPTARTLQQVRDFFTWNKKSLRYVDPSGQFVKSERVRRALLRVVDGAGKQIGNLADQLIRGDINVGQWQSGMEQAVKDLHLASTAAGKGGFGSMTARDFGLSGARLRNHYERIDEFSRSIENGQMSPAKIRWRANLYVLAAKGVYENSRREAARGVMTEERRLRGKRDSCPTCIEQAGLGWQPIGTLKRLGDSECKAACGCEFRFRKQAA